MLAVRKSDERGRRDHGWLDTRHTFSFADYYDPAHEHFGVLRVINEDIIDPGRGFGMHPHRDMEILTYVISGALAHKDSTGHAAVVRPGEIQRMSAGTGIVHSEFNHSRTEPLHLLQIWILPQARGLQPGYEQKQYDHRRKPDSLCLLASRAGGHGAVGLNQDVNLYEGRLGADSTLEHAVEDGRETWIQVVAGQLEVQGTALDAGDGCGIRHDGDLRFRGLADATFLMFDMGR